MTKIEKITVTKNGSIILRIKGIEYEIEADNQVLKLKKGDIVDKQQIRLIEKKQLVRTCWNRALKYLNRSRCKNEIIQKLKQIFGNSEKEIDINDIINQTVLRLEKLGLINDRNYCQNYINYKKNKSRAFIRYELRRRGLDREIVEACLIGKTDQENQAIRQIIVKKLANNKTNDWKQINKLISSLISKGFPYHTVKSQIDCYLKKK